MSVLNASNLAVRFGSHDVFAGLSFSVPPGARVALIGPNGSGKSSLLKIMAGEEAPDEGAVHRSGGLTIGYLPQHPDLAESRPLRAAMRAVFAELDDQADALRHLEARMAAGDDVLEEYGRKQAAFEAAGGYTLDARIERVLSGLGFEPDDFDRPIGEMSGGQQTRALLARILLEEPDLLLLDEPTNHLDVLAIAWLEATLKSWDGSLVVVAHDRAFLDAVVDRVWELAAGRLEEYPGNYSAYLRLREDRRARRLAEYEAQQAEIARTEEFIRRNLAGQNTRQAQGRRTRLERMERLERPPDTHAITLKLPEAERSGDKVLRAHHLVAGYAPGEPIITADALALNRGDRVAVLGPNGSGKTTLLKTLIGELDPLAGDVELGASLRVARFSQTHADLDREATALAQVTDGTGLTDEEARGLLGSMGLSGDDALRRVGSLSGGERARVALCRLLLARANFLVLDEPTNHLDLPSQEALETALSDWNGTLLLVTHDRYLVQQVTDVVWGLDAGRVRVYPEGYPAYMADHQPNVEDDPEKQARIREHEDRKQRQRSREREAARVVERREELEARVETLEAKLAELEASLEAATAAQDTEQIAELGDAYAATRKALDETSEAWLQAVEAEEASAAAG